MGCKNSCRILFPIYNCRGKRILFLYCFGKRHEHCQLFEKKYFSCLMIKKVIRFVRRKKRILFPRQLYMGNKIRQEFLQPINFPIFYKKNAEKQNFCWTIKEISIINLFSNQCSGSSVGRAEDWKSSCRRFDPVPEHHLKSPLSRAF